jgi:hypothetical protein
VNQASKHLYSKLPRVTIPKPNSPTLPTKKEVDN